MKHMILILILALSLTACTSVPIVAKFPDAPSRAGATARCPQLQKVPDAPKLSEISQTITINYGTYYECAIKVDAWREWYDIQKNIFEGITK